MEEEKFLNSATKISKKYNMQLQKFTEKYQKLFLEKKNYRKLPEK